MNSRTQNKYDTALDELIEEIESVVIDESWSLPVSDVLELFSIKTETFFRHAYQQKRGIDETFGSHNTDDLIEFLLHCGIEEAPARFRESGYYFTADDCVAFQELFVSVFLNTAENHPIDRDLLETSLLGCRDPADGFSFYCDAVFDPDRTLRFCAELYLEKNGIEDHSVSRRILIRFIERQLHQRAIRLESLLEEFVQKLNGRAVSWKFLDPPETRIEIGSLPSEIKGALNHLEFSLQTFPSAETIKSRYRALVKQHHPDLNPAGLAKTKQLTEAYSLLLRYIEQRQ